MKNIIEDLYFGEIQPNLQSYNNDSQYSDAMSTISTIEEKLNLLLDGDEKKMFLEFVNANDELIGVISSSSFVNGFKLGGSIAVQILSD